MINKKTIIICIIIILILIFGGGYLYSFYNRTAGVQIENSENQKFHNTQIYIDNMANELSHDRRELQTTSDSTTRSAIINDINDRFSNFDENKLNDDSLKQFLIDIRNGSIK